MLGLWIMKRKPGITKVELTVASIAFALLMAWTAGYIDTARPVVSVCIVAAIFALCFTVFGLAAKAYSHFFRN